MGMGMKLLKWEGIGTKNLFPHTSRLCVCVCVRACVRACCTVNCIATALLTFRRDDITF